MIMPAKKKESKIATEDTIMEENMFANVAAINALTDIVASYGDRLLELEGDMEKVAIKLKQVLSRMGL